MEVIAVLALLAVFAFAARSKKTRRGASPGPRPQSGPLVNRKPAPPRPGDYKEPQTARKLKGKCWVIDGDTIVIERVHIRIAGIDAPELNHPWGRNSKSALIKLCKGQVITAELHPESTYDRAVGTCLLPDGQDLAAELVKMGLAIDWPKFSGGKYSHLEPAGIRKKLWRADAKQKGRYDARRHG
ncbi:thermonuclease family protein [Salibaculum sp.]|uniref:thermonuclease family protein n=1 Tax=Salibaculum sp. TaxID=2855480 RepID=UPI002B473234|nr:thermonuclease family protein [Salibaculum sp.]HKL68558.1 thermonuclease family protein [Salibaculum sp.]